MTTTTSVAQFKLNIMTQSQYNTATIRPDEFYLVTDATISYNDLTNTPTLGTMAAEDAADYQPLLVSGTNIKTINNTSLLGSGNITVGGSLPSQTSHSGEFLTTNGSAASWTALSTFTGATTYTAGTAGIVPAPTAGNDDKALIGNGTWAYPKVYEVSISGGGSIKFWKGTQAEYDLIQNPDSSTLYIITSV